MLFDFNKFSSLLLLGVVQGLVMALVLLWRAKQEGKLADYLLAVLILLLTFHVGQFMLGFAGWYDSHDWHSSFMFYFPFHLYLLIGPVLYFYFRSLTNQAFQFEKKERWHFVPGGIHLLLLLFVFVKDVVWEYWILGRDFTSHFNTRGEWAIWSDFFLEEIASQLGLLSALIYVMLTIYRYRQYRKYLNDHFSATKDIEFHWIRNVLYALLAVFLFRLGIELIGQFFPDWGYQQYWVSYFVFALVIYFISIQGYTATLKLPALLAFTIPEEKPEIQEEAKELSTELHSWKDRLVTLMEQEKPYLQSELNLQDLAKKLNTNPSLLSKVINQGIGKNFNDYINSYRVKAVEEKLRNNAAEQLTLMGIALDCGFNSKATFNRAFRKFTGKSPREYGKGE